MTEKKESTTYWITNRFSLLFSAWSIKINFTFAKVRTIEKWHCGLVCSWVYIQNSNRERQEQSLNEEKIPRRESKSARQLASFLEICFRKNIFFFFFFSHCPDVEDHEEQRATVSSWRVLQRSNLTIYHAGETDADESVAFNLETARKKEKKETMSINQLMRHQHFRWICWWGFSTCCYLWSCICVTEWVNVYGCVCVFLFSANVNQREGRKISDSRRMDWKSNVDEILICISDSFSFGRFFSPSHSLGLCRCLFIGCQGDQSSSLHYCLLCLSCIIIQLGNEWRKNFYQSIRLTLSRGTCFLWRFEFNLDKARTISLERLEVFSDMLVFLFGVSRRWKQAAALIRTMDR